MVLGVAASVSSLLAAAPALPYLWTAHCLVMCNNARTTLSTYQHSHWLWPHHALHDKIDNCEAQAKGKVKFRQGIVTKPKEKPIEL